MDNIIKKYNIKLLPFLKQFQSYIGLIIIIIVASFVCVKDGENLFLDINNIMNVLRAISENGIIAVGMTLVILLGGIDLSVGSVLGLVSTGSAALMMHNGFGFWPTIIISLVIGGLYGTFNGLIITKMAIQPFIVTLASMNIARGLARFWSGGIGIPLSYGEGLAPYQFEFLQMRIGGIVPVPSLIFLVVVIIFVFVMKKTRFGRQVYATGGNERAAFLSGINVDSVKIKVFMLCGVLSAIAGVLHSAQISQGGPNEGIGYELNAVAAVCIGGTSLAGGKGSIIGTLVGAIILGLLDNVLGLNGVNSNLQLVVKGLIIIIAVFMQAEKKSE